MSYDWVKDINDMHFHYGMDISGFDKAKLKLFLKFRAAFLQEELDEMNRAIDLPDDELDAEEVIDALIDLSVVAIGTLDLLEVNSYLAWDVVLTANMAKEVGIKEGRHNPLGLPDLKKPLEWQAPSHVGNYGLLDGQ